jgi:hypothetical protein
MKLGTVYASLSVAPPVDTFVGTILSQEISTALAESSHRRLGAA